jgi:hypothetical protein
VKYHNAPNSSRGTTSTARKGKDMLAKCSGLGG